MATKNHTARGYVKGQPYRFVKGHHRTLGRIQSVETREKIRQSRLGEKHPLWKGDKAGYFALHEWLIKNHPKTGRCGSCRQKTKTEYAFLRHPEPHTRNIDHYAELCRDCHMEYDALLRKDVA